MRHLIVVLLLGLIPLFSSGADTELSIIHPTENFHLGGTLTIPDDIEKPRAVLVLATGSGQQTRDEEIFGHKIFKDIADYLAQRGYATIRLDDRGIGASEGDFASATTDDFVTDISAAVDLAATRFADVPVGVLGHSEGGIIAIRMGAHSPNCSFIVTLAAPAWPGDSIIMSQARALAEGTSGVWEKDKEQLQRSLLDICKSELPAPLARPIFIATLGSGLGEVASLPAVQQQISASADAMLSDWYREFLRYNPEADIRSVEVPWLALNGKLDTQVLPGNLDTISELNPAVDVVYLDRHNHLFQHCTTGLVNEYPTISESISEETLGQIADWLHRNFGQRNR